MKGIVVSIYTAPAASEPMVALDEARAIAGKGIEGDRYFSEAGTFSPDLPSPDHEITLIEIEAIEALHREYGVALDPGDARRNIVTRDVPLNHLVGREFKVGETVIRGIRLCEPCSHLAGLTEHKVLTGLIHRGGLRAQILKGGIIRAGDDVEA